MDEKEALRYAANILRTLSAQDQPGTLEARAGLLAARMQIGMSLSPSGKTRRWSNARGTSLYAALEAARKIQEGKE